MCKYNSLIDCKSVDLPLSKSISNRFLIANALSKRPIQNTLLSEAEDSVILNKIITDLDERINVGKAGTAFRFLTAYLSTLDKTFVLDGDSRMRQRPIGVLVDKLRELGASISYLEKEGFPPLQIRGNLLQGRELAIEATVSSQFISALLLIAPSIKNGVELNLQGEIVSSPYIDMTLKLMQEWGIGLEQKGNKLIVQEGNYVFNSHYKIEADWSSAAFIYQFFALSKLKTLFIENLSLKSVQGDSRTASLFEFFGVKTRELDGGIELFKIAFEKKEVELDMLDVPDLIPAFVVTAAALAIPMKITGVKTLKNKESDRLFALKTELAKYQAVVDYNDNQLVLSTSFVFEDGVLIETYHDHRIAMAFAPLAIFGTVVINDPDVVVKSFPSFWKEMNKLGLVSKELPS